MIGGRSSGLRKTLRASEIGAGSEAVRGWKVARS